MLIFATNLVLQLWLTEYIAIIIALLVSVLAVNFSGVVGRLVKVLKPNKSSTYGREFLLLLEKNTRRECAARLPFFYKWTVPMLWVAMIGSVRFARPFKPIEWLFVAIVLLSYPYLYIRRISEIIGAPVLLPLYHARRREAAERRRKAAEQALTATLPPLRYRVAAGATEVERLRVKLRERVLTDEQAREASIIIQAHDEMTEAEQALTELEAAKTKASTQTT